ncbi:MAG: 3-phosphoglycerate dehydrogenase family protein [Bacteroidetes bacterium]|nr:3-phosphoglycerate dehydrogenase family protein [Bacteroidota bacterium]MCL5739220.1 3-phosphoglycerate dehydrogenase family protein [Bacteroidota bacterium]
MKVLIADKLSDKTVSALKKLGMDISVDTELTAENLPQAVGDSDTLIVRSTKVTAKTIEAANNLSLIIRAGAGVNTIDLAAANARGIYVSNCPGKNTEAVAELAIGFLIAADRQIANATIDLRNGFWKKKEYGKARGLKGRVLGIIGFGAIGKAVAKRAQSLEMKVLVWSRSLTKENAEQFGVISAPDPVTLAQQSDAISVHVAYKPETHHLINKVFLDAMKNGSILVNTSRGEVVDTSALKEAIKTKKLRVGLDVFEDEPAGGEASFGDKELAEVITGTPHIGASTDQASEAIADEVVQIVKSFQETGVPFNTVNIRARSSATQSLVVRHYNRVGVLAGILDKLRSNGINVEEMTNIIFETSKAACCTLLLDDAPSSDVLSQMQKDENIIEVALKPLTFTGS